MKQNAKLYSCYLPENHKYSFMAINLKSDQLVPLVSFVLSERRCDEISMVAAKALLSTETPSVFLNEAWLAAHSCQLSSLVGVCVGMGRHGHLNTTVDFLLRHEDYQFRFAAADALGQIGNPAALPALQEAQADPIPLVRFRAEQSMRALQQQNPESMPIVTLQFNQREQVIADLITGTWPADLFTLGRLLNDDNHIIRSMADGCLVRLKVLEKEQFLAALDHHELPVSPGVLRLLGSLRDERGVKHIPEATSDLSYEQREAAIAALADIANTEAMNRLIGYLDNPKQYDRSTVSEALRGFGEAIKPLIIHAYRRNSWIRRSKARLVGELAGVDALNSFLEALHDHHKLVRDNAEEGLEVLGEAAVQPLISLLSSTDATIRIHATRVLGSIGHESAFEAIAGMVSEANMEQRRVAVEALGGFSNDRCVELLSIAIRSKDSATRRGAFKAMGRIKDQRVIEILRAVLLDADSQVRLEAVRFLGLIGIMEYPLMEQFAEVLILALEDQHTEVAKLAESALIRIGRPALRPLKNAAQKGLRGAGRALEICEKKKRRTGFRFSPKNSVPVLSPGRALERVESSIDMPRPVTDSVQFSVTTPRILVAGQSFVLDVWAYTKDDLAVVIERARAAQNGRETRVRIKGPVSVARQAVMHLALQVPDFRIENLEDTIYWTGDIGNATFPVRVPSDATEGPHLGKVSILVSGLLIAKLDFEMEVGIAQQEADDVTRHEIRPRTAFASYASEDRDEVLGRIQGMLKVLPELDIFLDVASLRSGEKWLDRLEEEIESRDVFYLFWSLAASRSPWVEKEWRTALTTKGLEHISPVPLETPEEAPPPHELASLHFGEWTLAYRSRPDTQ